MKVLITGATGFVGSHLAEMLKELGYDINCIHRKSSNLRWLKDKSYNIIEADLFNINSLKTAMTDIDYVFHLAGVTFAKDTADFLKGNAETTKNLIEAVHKYCPNIKRFVYLSSQTVGGPSISFDTPVNEDIPPNPLTSYGKSKKAAEDVILQNIGSIPYTIIRAPAIIGPRDTAIYDLFKTANMGIGTLIGFKPKYLSLLYVQDICTALVKSAESSEAINKAYYVSSKEFYSWDYLIGTIGKSLGKKRFITLKIPHFLVLTIAYLSELSGKISGKPPVFNYEKGIDFIQSYWTCSNQKAEKDFGFSQQVPIDEGIKLTINWYKENKWLK